jgi:hypothetical protein
LLLYAWDALGVPNLRIYASMHGLKNTYLSDEVYTSNIGDL